MITILKSWTDFAGYYRYLIEYNSIRFEFKFSEEKTKTFLEGEVLRFYPTYVENNTIVSEENATRNTLKDNVIAYYNDPTSFTNNQKQQLLDKLVTFLMKKGYL